MIAAVTTPAPETRDVAVVAASPLMLTGLAHSIEGMDGFRATYRTDSVTGLPADSFPSLIVIDLSGKPFEDEGFWTLMPPSSRVVALCIPDRVPDLMVAARHGVRALVSRGCDITELKAALRTAVNGGLYVSPDVFSLAASAAEAVGTLRIQQLTPREIEVLQLLANGLTHGQISRQLGLTAATVNTYVKRIRHKLHVGNKADLTRRAIELGYVPT
ncbi:response regulator transcription factor [Actinoplanes solisilvae]|uniref:response regulator transcription factor n=1 Tax=Actinoplanes solisilvae TaxID=2486853 RepID=UPI0013E40447|nr:response regulator transcription factor [Actinoplanes solisilvae]